MVGCGRRLVQYNLVRNNAAERGNTRTVRNSNVVDAVAVKPADTIFRFLNTGTGPKKLISYDPSSGVSASFRIKPVW